MIKLITGKKGTGKTKILVDMINNAVKDTNGDLICIEKGAKLTYDIKEVFIDGILKIGGTDFDELGKLLEKLNILSGNDTQITFTISADNSELPESVMQFV